MEFEEIKKLREYFEKNLSYKGFNLWCLSEAALYNNFLKDEKHPHFSYNVKSFISRFVVRKKNHSRSKSEPSNNPSSIVIVVNGVTQVNTAKILLGKLKNAKVVCYDSPFDNTTQRVLEEKRIPYTLLDSYANRKMEDDLKKAKVWLSQKWKFIKSDVKFRKLIGKDYDLIISSLKHFFSYRMIYLEYIRMILLYENLFSYEQFKKVVVFDDVNAYGRTPALLAQKKGKKSFCIQHGQLQGNPVGEITCDKMLVNGTSDKDFLVSLGAPKSKIIVTGQIRYDSMVSKMKTPREVFCRKYGLNPHKMIVVYSYQKPMSNENVITPAINLFLRDISKIKDFDDYQVVVTCRKDTPTSSLDFSMIKFLPGADIQEVAVCSEVLVTAFSTAASEFILMGKPVITINLGDYNNEYIDYTKLGVGFKIVKEEDFLPSLEKCLNNSSFKKSFVKAQKRFVKKNNYKMDGKALERVINSIESI